MTEQNIPPVPPPYKGEPEKKSSRKWIYWTIGIIGILVVGLIIVVQVAKTPHEDLGVYDEDPVREMMSEEEWQAAEEYAEQHGHIEETQDWEKLYVHDEFGEEIKSMPYMHRMINGYKIYGQSGQSDYDNMVVTLDPRYGIKLSIGDGEFNGNDRIIIKHNSGEKEEIPYESLDGGDIVISNPSAITRFIDILQSGNVEIAIAGNLNTRYWNFVISDQFKSIRKALRFFRDVPNVESIYGTIN